MVFDPIAFSGKWDDVIEKPLLIRNLDSELSDLKTTDQYILSRLADIDINFTNIETYFDDLSKLIVPEHIKNDLGNPVYDDTGLPAIRLRLLKEAAGSSLTLSDYIKTNHGLMDRLVLGYYNMERNDNKLDIYHVSASNNKLTLNPDFLTYNNLIRLQTNFVEAPRFKLATRTDFGIDSFDWYHINNPGNSVFRLDHNAQEVI